MPHIHFNLTDPRWAIVLAGVIQNARMPGFKEINQKLTVSFEKNSDFMSRLADVFEAKPSETPDYTLPSPEQYPFIDTFQAQSHARSLFEQHGIKQDPVIVPLYLNALAANSLLLTHKVSSKVGFFMPKPTKQQLEQAPDSDVIIENESMRRVAEQFAEGYGIESPVIISAEDYSEADIAAAMFKTKILTARPHHYTQYIARSQYKGFDHIHENIPVVSVIDDSCKHDNRFLVSWNAQIPVFLDDTNEVLKARGKAWKIRKNYNFNHRDFYKDAAAGTLRG